MTNELDKAKEILDSLVESEQDLPSLPSKLEGWVTTVVEYSELRKAVLAVVITLLIKKVVSPKQDIRQHQAKLNKGFSARVLDTNLVTPFLTANNFPNMKSGSGALTRSLEESRPFDLKYTGSINPIHLKEAFLNIIDQVQVKKEDPKIILAHIIKGLVISRDKSANISLAKPYKYPIKDLLVNIKKHIEICDQASRLPHLAIYAIYGVLVNEMTRYKKYYLCELRAHQAPDKNNMLLGDIQINDIDNHLPFEVVEIKYNIKLNVGIVDACYDKFKNLPVKNYYLLSTCEDIEENEKISDRIIQIYNNHGCQVVVNGVFTTLKYYLRLISEAGKVSFIDSYVGLIEKECNYETKMAWEDLFNESKKKDID